MYNLSLDTILGGVTTTLCTISGNATTIVRGTFQQESCCTYASGYVVPSGDLFLKLTAATCQLDVDNVSLTVQSAATGVPKPNSLLLLGLAMLLVFSAELVNRKKVVRVTT
jgi:hypothetical protein